MTERSRASWVVYALGALCAGAIVAAVLVVGPASGSQATVTRTATVAEGVVQSTVTGSGNLQAVSQLNLGFKTGGTVTRISVTQGQQVAAGQLIAELDPQSAEVSLEQAKASLQSAEANLAKEEETDGETASGSGGSGTAGSGGTGTASTASLRGTDAGGVASVAAYAPASTTTSATPGTAAETTPSPTTTTPAADTTPAANTAPAAKTTPGKEHTATTPSSTGTGSRSSEATSGSEGKESSGSTTKTTVSAATREANLASARAQVKSDTLTVQSAEQAVNDTKLYAPESGTIVSLSGQVGEVVTGSGTTKASSSSSSSSGSGATGATGAGSATGRSATSTASSSTGSSGSSGSSSAFAVLSDLSSMQLVAPLSESEIGNVRTGQIATVTVEALSGRKLAAHVSEVAILSTSNSGVVSYDVTFHLDQMDPGLKPGMSATAEVVVKQAEGINVPTSAITAGTVTVVRGGQHVRQRVVTGLAGNSSTIILSGLKAGETVVLPSTTTGAAGGTSTKGRSGLGGLGGLGGGGAFPGGGAAFFRGGG